MGSSPTRQAISSINNSKYSYYNLFTKDPYSLALRDYYIKSFKNYNNADINLGTYTENAYNYNFNTIHLYVTQAPTLVNVSILAIKLASVILFHLALSPSHIK